MSSADYQRRWRAEQARKAGRTPGTTGRPVTRPCGTVAAYRRHLANDEPPCDACRAANTEATRRRRTGT